jgi:hypothetical protein
MRICALDLSKSSTGFACWGPEDSKTASGVWELGSIFTSRGRVFQKLHMNLLDLHTISPIDAIFYEDGINIFPGAVATNAESIKLSAGLAAHAESFAEAIGARHIHAVNMTTWRRHFLGKMPRGTRKSDLKEMAMERCRQLGFKPAKHDEAEAIGILDYACDALGITPYWSAGEVLRPPLERAR